MIYSLKEDSTFSENILKAIFYRMMLKCFYLCKAPAEMCLWRAPYQVNIFLCKKGRWVGVLFFQNILPLFFKNKIAMIITEYHKKKRKRKILPNLYGGMGSLLGSWQTYILPIAKFGYICLIDGHHLTPMLHHKIEKNK